MSKPTDIEVLAKIFEDFPLDLAQLMEAHKRLDNLVFCRDARHEDGSIDPKMWQRARLLTNALNDLVWVVNCIETDGDPDDFIPF